MCRKTTQWMASAALAIITHACSASDRPVKIQGHSAPMKINRVDVGTSSSKVRSLFGTPEYSIQMDSFIRLELTYPEIIIGFDEDGGVAMMKPTSPSACMLSMHMSGIAIKSDVA